MPTTSGADGRVFVHVGVPKTGTSFLQAGLRQRKERLRELGFLYPGDYAAEMYHAALEIRANEERWGHELGSFDGTWARICERALGFEGTSIISHELLAAATPEQVRQALAELDGLEVHVLVTARDLARQLPAAWQQGAKHGGLSTFADFSARVLGDQDDERARHFWSRQDILDVLARWGEGLPADRVHVVTCPRQGASPNVLWERFCAAVGIPSEQVEPPTRRANTSLGVTEVELLRRVNKVLGQREDRRLYGRMVNRFLVNQVLRKHTSPRAVTPPSLLPRLREVAKAWVDAIETAGYDVVGDLHELVPEEPTPQTLDPDTIDPVLVDPDAVDPEAALDLAVATVADLLRRIDGLRSQANDLRQAAQEARQERNQLARRLEAANRSTLRRAGGTVKRMLDR